MNGSMRRLAILLLSVLWLSAADPQRAAGDNFEWVGPPGGDFHDPNNWLNTDTMMHDVPGGPEDTIIFKVPADVIVSIPVSTKVRVIEDGEVFMNQGGEDGSFDFPAPMGNLGVNPQFDMQDQDDFPFASFNLPVQIQGDTGFRSNARGAFLMFNQGFDANGFNFYNWVAGPVSAVWQTTFTSGISNVNTLFLDRTTTNISGTGDVSGVRITQRGGTTTITGTNKFDVVEVELSQNGKITFGGLSSPFSENVEIVFIEDGTWEITQAGAAITMNAPVDSGTGISRVRTMGENSTVAFQEILGGTTTVMNLDPGSTNSQFSATNIQNAAGSSPVYWMTWGAGNTFADWDSTTGVIGPFPESSYVDINSAGPNDVAQPLPCCVTMTHDLSADITTYAGRLGAAFGSTLNGNGHTWTTNSLLNTGANWFVTNLNLQPPDREGDGNNELLLLGRIGATQNVIFTDTSDITDNGAPTDLAIGSVRPEFRGVLSKTGVTRILGGGDISSQTSVTLMAGASLGGDLVELHGDPTLVLDNNTFTQDIGVFSDANGAGVRGINAARVEGDTFMNIVTLGDRPMTFIAFAAADSITIAGDGMRTGVGAGVGIGQGRAVVNFGGSATTVAGPIITEATADWTDPGLEIHVRTQQFRHNGQAGETQVHDNVTASGNGSYTSLLLSGTGSRLSPGNSIGTTTVAEDLIFDGTNNRYAAEVTDDGQSDMLAIGGTLDLVSTSDILDISFLSGTTLADATYTLATYAAVSGIFDSVMFAGAPIADPTAAGAFQGTHQLFYSPTALVLTTAVPALPGDYNDDGKVDAADYVVWRKFEGTTTMLPNDLFGGTIDERQFNQWRANFGNMAGAGGSAGQTVPEPASVALFALSAVFFVNRRCRNQRFCLTLGKAGGIIRVACRWQLPSFSKGEHS